MLQFLSLAIFSFGAPAFTVLSLFYWRKDHKSTPLFRVFTAVCAVAFVSSLVSTLLFVDNSAFRFSQGLLTSLLPVLMLHLAVEGSAVWRIPVGLVYALAATCAIGREAGWGDWFDASGPIVLGLCAGLALVGLWWPRRARKCEKGDRWWTIGIFAAMFGVAVAAGVSENTAFEIAPDYLLLLFFAVRLYSAERLAFFDVFVRVVVFFALGLMILTFAFLGFPAFRNALGGDWNRAWLAAMALVPVWLGAPFVYRRLSEWIDRRAFGRRFSPVGAERLFVQSAQSATHEAQLLEYARDSLAEIFGCEAEVDFTRGPDSENADDMVGLMAPAGMVRLIRGERRAPFLSDDRRLLESLTATLGVLLQNARLREQREGQLLREQELLALAGRAEVRALRAQINPHFLFNSLNAVASCIRSRPDAAEDTLTRLAEVFRYTLHRSSKEWVALGEEMDFIRAYLAVEQARFAERLQVSIEMQEGTAGLQVPAMIVQPLVENAIKHGTSQVLGTGRVTIVIGVAGGVLRIDVRDNGSGFPSSFARPGSLDENSPGHGLHNVADRLCGYYGGSGELQFDRIGTDTCVRIQIPLPILSHDEPGGMRKTCAF